MVRVARSILEEVAGYVAFESDDAKLLVAVGSFVRPAFPAIVEEFYAAIEANPGAAAVIRGGKKQIARLKEDLRQWLEGIVGGVYDAAYLERRQRIGHVHVRIGLDQRYMLSAMNILRAGLHRALDDALGPSGASSSWPADRVQRAHRAIDKICDIELAVMLETYRHDYVARIRSSERLASIGQLAASIGHELRNPLAVMETSLHLLGSRVQDDDRADKHLRRLGKQVKLCENIIADLLEMVRDRAPRREPVDAGAILREVVHTIPTKPNVSFEVQIADDIGLMMIDGVQFRQVCVNLLMNAAQAVASTGGGTVWAQLARSDEWLRLGVEDNGPGLPPGDPQRLFEPLFTTRSKGIGLGLTLCQRIAEMHGGRIQAQDRAQGGARFEVSLPPGETRPADHAALPSQDEKEPS
jgi:signal transduction histidine kinase